MSNRSSDLHGHLLRLCEPIAESLRRTLYTPQESSNISTRDVLLSLLPGASSQQGTGDDEIHASIKNFALACALLSSSRSSTHELLSWIPESLSTTAESTFREVSGDYFTVLGKKNAGGFGEFRVESEDKKLVIELLPEILPQLKDRIKQSSIGKGTDAEDISAAMARTPVGYAILAAYQLRWFVTQVEKPHLGKLCNLVIPCALTALDHWSIEVKGQGMISFIHLAKNVTAAELSLYGDVILDACCQNIASADEIWIHVVEMSVLFVTIIQKNHPRSSWYEKIMNEMLSHLERQPRNKERHIAWLRFIEPIFNALGLFLLAHFQRIFALFFQWMHVDDDETVLLVLERVRTVLRLTWIRSSPHITRLVDELVSLYKESSIRKAREDIRSRILCIFMLLKESKALQFEKAWKKHQEDPNLSMVSQYMQSSFTRAESLTSLEGFS